MSTIAAVCNPEQVAHALGAAGVDCVRHARLRLERAWPNRRGGLSASWRGEDGLWSVHGPSEPPRDARRALRKGCAVRLSELGCWAHRFPLDPSLPQLSARIEHDRDRSQASSTGSAPQVVSYKPLRRCVLRNRDGRFVKLLRPESAAEVASIYRSIASTPLLGSMEVAIPESVDTSEGLLVWPGSPGGPLLDDCTQSEIADRMQRVGFGLGRLQGIDVPWQRRHRAADELATLATWVEAAAGAFPAASKSLRITSNAIAGAAPDETGAPVVPAHRDFHDGQLLAAGERVTLLDLDTASLAAPELDVANFLAHLRLRSLQREDFRWQEAAHAFLAGRSESRAVALDSARLQWYDASTLLRLACVHAFRPFWGELSEALVSAATGRLELDCTGGGSAT